MLVLSRKKDEDILIQTPEGRVVTVRIVEILGERVRLGFVADDSVSILRKELIESKEDKNGLERPAAGGPVHSS